MPGGVVCWRCRAGGEPAKCLLSQRGAQPGVALSLARSSVRRGARRVVALTGTPAAGSHDEQISGGGVGEAGDARLQRRKPQQLASLRVMGGVHPARPKWRRSMARAGRLAPAAMPLPTHAAASPTKGARGGGGSRLRILVVRITGDALWPMVYEERAERPNGARCLAAAPRVAAQSEWRGGP